MKCPKCGYLGFEHVERCRNCGYDFSLTASSSLPELSIRVEGHDRIGPFDDLSLADPQDHASSADALRDLPTKPMRAGGARRAVASADLPLFGTSLSDDIPLITKASPPRQPLAVRRATPDVPRLRAEARPVPLELLLPDLDEPPPGRPPASRNEERQEEHSAAPAGETAASLTRRAIASVIDLLVLLGIDVVVVYFTMQISGVTIDDLDLLPRVPLLTFLLLQDATYLVALTAGGQTLGKMATGIRVVVGEAGSAPGVSGAALRTLVWLVLAVPAGLGFFSVLFDADHRGFHDRLAGTRVVRASL